MAAIPSGAEGLANSLLTGLTAGKDFTLPAFDADDPIFDQPDDSGPLYDAVDPITVDDLTTGVVGGTGVFDKIMVSLVQHLKVEYENDRISGAEYTKAYIAAIGAALQTAQQFLLGKDQAYWQALLVQAQAREADVQLKVARVQLETAKIALVKAKIETFNVEATYALTKMKLATEDITYANLQLQGLGIEATTSLTEMNITKTNQEVLNLISQKATIDYTNLYILPNQKNLITAQAESQNAQISDTKLAGGTVTGAIGKQKDLYAQQIRSYKYDSLLKGGKLWADMWVTQKTIDEGLVPPAEFTNTTINTVMAEVRAEVINQP